MPISHEFSQATTNVLSLGGNTVRPSRIDISFTELFIDWVQSRLDTGHAIIAVVGGGGVARDLIEDAKTLGINKNSTLDNIGINVTKQNASFLMTVFAARGLHASLRRLGDIIQNNTVYFQGGQEFGHTTDYVAVQAALDADQHILLNISSIAGIHPFMENGELDRSVVIPEMTWDEYLAMMPKSHEPGQHVPFDPIAAKLAHEYGIIVVMVAPDFDNINRLLSGEEFVGTIIHP